MAHCVLSYALDDTLFGLYSERISWWANRMYFRHELIDWDYERLRLFIGSLVPEGSLISRLQAVAEAMNSDLAYLTDANDYCRQKLLDWKFSVVEQPAIHAVAAIRSVGWLCAVIDPVARKWALKAGVDIEKDLGTARAFDESQMNDCAQDKPLAEAASLQALALEIAVRIWWVQHELGAVEPKNESIQSSLEILQSLVPYTSRFKDDVRAVMEAEIATLVQRCATWSCE